MSNDRYYIDNINAVIMTACDLTPSNRNFEHWAAIVIKAAVEAGIPPEELRDAIYRIYGDELNEE
jgi:hypothetical protein